MTQYEDYAEKSRIGFIIDKLLWLYLWPPLLLMIILDVRVRLTSAPKRFSLISSNTISWFIERWLYKKSSKISKIFRFLGYRGSSKPKE